MLFSSRTDYHRLSHISQSKVPTQKNSDRKSLKKIAKKLFKNTKKQRPPPQPVKDKHTKNEHIILRTPKNQPNTLTKKPTNQNKKIQTKNSKWEKNKQTSKQISPILRKTPEKILKKKTIPGLHQILKGRKGITPVYLWPLRLRDAEVCSCLLQNSKPLCHCLSWKWSLATCNEEWISSLVSVSDLQFHKVTGSLTKPREYCSLSQPEPCNFSLCYTADQLKNPW